MSRERRRLNYPYRRSEKAEELYHNGRRLRSIDDDDEKKQYENVLNEAQFDETPLDVIFGSSK